MRVTNITTASVREYIAQRLEAGAANATINRELAALKRAFNVASQCTPPKVPHVPYIPML
ncbi:MAG: site-specific integrase [Deltaproteobacteria bacterium]|nr:site-specific integrase [Deltaproteobacteria bacterium]